MEKIRKKIGIVSLYHNNKNYGGLLQAYALTKYISTLGYNAEQVCWNAVFHDAPKQKIKFRKIFHYVSTICWLQVKNILRVVWKDKINSRIQAFEKFESAIKHSEKCYDGKSFLKDCGNYDAVVIGSDQVWNINWYDTQYFLDFVPNDVYKFSYAASMPDVNISDEMKNIVKNALEGFNAISVREKKTAAFLSELCERNVEYVIDPTLLLNVEQWDDISGDKLVECKYIFCYFLGRHKHYRKYTKKVAKKTGLKIVSLPHLCGVAKEDLNFADINLYDVSPGDFVSLIKNAEYVLTDSFHAAVFSNIYRVKYFVFDRSGMDMSERIVTLLDMFNSKERFIRGTDGLERLLRMKDLPVNTDLEQFEKALEKSKRFLDDNLKKCCI